MESVIEFARDGGLVLGICNGFQVLCEAGLLPGALLPNVELRFICRQVDLEVVDARHAVHARDCAAGEMLSIPVKHTTGRYYAPPSDLERSRPTARSCCATRRDGNPNGSLERHRRRAQRRRATSSA